MVAGIAMTIKNAPVRSKGVLVTLGVKKAFNAARSEKTRDFLKKKTKTGHFFKKLLKDIQR